MKALDLSGQKFGKLLVIKKVGVLDTHCLYECKCDCGNTVHVKSISLKHSGKKCCGCTRPRPCGEITPTIWNNIKARKTKNGWGHGNAKIKEFDITMEYIWDLFLKQNRKCAISGVEIEFGKKPTASLDRIDSKRGYVKDNIQWLHKVVNNMKQNLSDEQFVTFCILIAEHKDA